MLQSLRVALVHDWLTGMRGGEKVLEVFCRLFPNAPIYTMLHNRGSVSPTIEQHPIITSGLQNMPGAATRYRHYLPLLPYFAERLRIEPVDLVVSISSCVAKGIRPPVGAKHASYILSPMRYLYDRYDDYFAPGRAGLATRVAMKMVRRRLQDWDRASTDRVDSLVGISTFICQRIRTVYGRNSGLIFPPVEVGRFAINPHAPRDYYLIVSALAPYKNVDIAVEAFRGLDRRLVVAGSGPMMKRLQAIRPPNVELRGWVADDEVERLVAGCRAFIFPNVEDFGIAPVEAMAAGRPVIALGDGGALDTIRDLRRWRQRQFSGSLGPSGLFFDEPIPSALAEAIRQFEAEEQHFTPTDIARWASQFDRAHFERHIVDWLEGLMQTQTARAA